MHAKRSELEASKSRTKSVFGFGSKQAAAKSAGTVKKAEDKPVETGVDSVNVSDLDLDLD